MKLTHINQEGRAQMVNIKDKAITHRLAKAQAVVTMKPSTLTRILDGDITKGDVLAVAQVAGIQAAKLTSQLIPMCHPLPLTHVDISVKTNTQEGTITLISTVSTEGKTGVEMEALTCVNIAALTVYDMCKSIDKAIRIDHIYLLEKHGGKSGSYTHPNHKEDHSHG